MDGLARQFFAKGLADSTQRTYKSAQNRYLSFCRDGKVKAIPALEPVLCRFVSHLASDGLKHKSIKAYLSAVRYLQIAEKGNDPFQPSLLRLQYVLRGIKRCEAEKGSKAKERLPITPGILKKLKESWSQSASDPDTQMLWAACTLAFFAFLRTGEMTVPSDKGYDPAIHLSFGDVTVDNPSAPTLMRVRIKQSKTDPFRKGVHLFVGRTSAEVCPVAAMLKYLVARGRGKGPLFKFRDGRPLTRQRLVDALRVALARVGLDQSKYCGHSFRIRAATTAATNGIEDSTLGRWRSLAYLQYVKIPRDQLANYSRVLCA